MITNNAKIVNEQDSDGRTALHVACMVKGNVNSLLQTGVCDVHVRDVLGNTPLHYAMRLEEAIPLLDAGADVLARSSRQMTPLLAAICNRCDLDVVYLLVAYGGRLRDTDADGWSSVHYAAATGSIHVLRVCIQEAGYDVLHMRTKNGSTPLDIARRAKNVKMRSFIKRRMKRAISLPTAAMKKLPSMEEVKVEMHAMGWTQAEEHEYFASLYLQFVYAMEFAVVYGKLCPDPFTVDVSRVIPPLVPVALDALNTEAAKHGFVAKAEPSGPNQIRIYVTRLF
jgi:hypothetical protein